MKKHLLIMLSIISMHAYAMEMEVKSTDPIIDLSVLLTYPTEILDLIAQFLSFYDYETEKEFIERTQALTIKKIPEKYRLALPYRNIRCVAYSPDNAIIALSEEYNTDMVGNVLNTIKNLTIINRTNNQQQVHTINRHNKLAVSRDGNLVATFDFGNPILTGSTYIWNYVLTITSLSTTIREAYIIKNDFKPFAIAFNKQGTNIIAHNQNSQHKIFPLTVNTPNPNADHKKTLSKYFAQRVICKNLTEQISHMKCLNNK